MNAPPPAAGGAEARAALEGAIAALEVQRAVLGDAVVDAAVAPLQARLAALGAAAAPAATPAPAPGVLRQVSVLFLDVVGSTALVERLGPEEAQEVFDGTLAACTGIVEAHGGRVLQYAGDSLLAAFGTLEVREDDAVRAVRCGLALLAEGQRVGRERAAAYGVDRFALRAGVHTGPVLLGGGVDADGGIRGLAVHVAARMEQTAPAGALRVSLDTWHLLQGRFEGARQSPIEVKGVAEPLVTYVVERELEAPALAPRRGVDGRWAPLVGRESPLAELARAPSAAIAAAAGAPDTPARRLTLIGEAGLGKSRLLAEALAQWSRLDPAPRVLAVDSQPADRLQPLGAWRGLLFRHLGLRDSATPDDARRVLVEAVSRALGERAEEQGALLGQWLGLDFADSPHVKGIVRDAPQLRARGLHVLVTLLRRWAAEAAPLVLLFDDAHWADDASLDAMASVAAALAGAPVLIGAAARPELLERRPHWFEGDAGAGVHVRLDLAPLSDGERAMLAHSLLQRLAEPSPRLSGLLAEQAGGNPFYMEALLQMLRDRGVIVDADGGGWRLVESRLAGLQVPATLVGVLQARLDALPAAQRRALQQASIVGAEFWDGALAAVEPAAATGLPALAARGLVAPRTDSAFEGSTAWAFAHHLLHQVTYATVLKRERQAGHAATARWLEARCAGREAEFAARIAAHCEQAGLDAQAAQHWAVAAVAASDRHADAAAAAHLERALALDDGSDPRRRFRLARVQSALGQRSGDAAAQLAGIETMADLAERLDDDVLRLIACQARMVRLMFTGGQFEEGVAIGESALARAVDAGPAERARTLNMLVIGYSRTGRVAEAHRTAAEAVALARAAGDRITEGAIENNHGLVQLDRFELAAAEAAFGRAVAAYESQGSRFGMVMAAVNQALALETAGRLEESRALVLRNIAVCREIGNRPHEGLSLVNLAALELELGQPEAALEMALQVLRLPGTATDLMTRMTAQATATLALRALGRPAEALEHAERAAENRSRFGDPARALELRALAAALLGEAGRLDEAMRRAGALLANHGDEEWREAYGGAFAMHGLLERAQDTRAARLLELAHAGLMDHAARLPDAAARDRFLEATAERRGIVSRMQARAAAVAGVSAA